MSRLHEIIADVLGEPLESIQDNSGPEDFLQWDSAAHLDIALSLEEEFGVAFSTREMVEMLSVQGFALCLLQKGVHLT